MSIQFTLPELIEVIKAAYKTIEVRTIAADINGKTYNVVTLIQFSISPPAVCRRNMRIRLAGHRLEKGPLQFGLACLPATKWPELADQLTTGELSVDGVTAKLGATFAPENFKSYISNNSSIENPTPYLVFQSTRSAESTSTELPGTLRYFVNTPEVWDQVNRSGFDGGFNELARCYLGVITFNSSEPSQVAIFAPVPAMIDSHIEFPDARRIRAHVRLHSKLRSSFRLKGDIIAGDQPPGKIKGAIRFGKLVSDKENQAHAESRFEVDSLNDDVHLILQHIGTLRIFHTRRFSVREAVPEGYQYIHGTLVPVALFDAREIPHLPEQARADLSRAMTFLAEGDNDNDDVAISLACGAVDKVIEAVYKKNNWQDRPNCFQGGVNTAMQRLGIFAEMEAELVACGIDAKEASTTAREMASATNHAAQALQVIRKTQGVAHGSRPTHSRMVYDTIKWASAICGLLEGKA